MRFNLAGAVQPGGQTLLKIGCWAMIESLNAKLRRAVRTRGDFPTDDSAMKLLYLVLNLAAKEWKMPPREWTMAKAQFAILFEGRFKIA